MRWYIAVLAVLLFSTNNTFSQNNYINFLDADWQIIESKARLQNKLIFVDAYTNWCAPCKWMDAEIFTNDTVADFFNERFINVKMDMQKPSSKEFANKYQITCYPTLVFLNADGKLIHRSSGGMSSKRIIELAIEASTDNDNFNYYETQFNSGNKNPEIIYNYLKLRDGSCLKMYEIAAEYCSSLSDADMENEFNQTIVFEFIKDVNTKEFEFLLKNINIFAAKYSREKVDKKISDLLLDECHRKIFGSENKQDYLDLKAKIEKLDYAGTDKLLLRADLEYYRKIYEWDSYTEVVKNSIEPYFVEDPDLVFKVGLDLRMVQKRKAFEEFKKQLIDKHVENAESILTSIDLSCYSQEQDWKKYSALASESIEKHYYNDPEMINGIAWTFYEHIQDPEDLKKAIVWIKRAAEIQRSEEVLDTWAALNFKLGNITEAIALEKEAIKLAKKKGLPTDDFEEMLRKIKETK